MAIVKGKLEVLDLNITRSAKLDGKYLFSEINGVLSNNKGQLNLTKMGLLPRSVDVLNTESTEFFWYTSDAKNVPDMNEYAHSMSIKSVNMTTVFTFNDKGKVLYRNKKNDTWDTVWTPLATEQFVVDTVNDALNGGGIDLSNYYNKTESDNKFMNKIGNITIQNGTDFPMVTYQGVSKIKGGILYNKGEFHLWDQDASGNETYRVKVPKKSGTLLLQEDAYSKDDIDKKFLPLTGGTLSGSFGISTGDYSGLTLYNKTNHLRIEGNPDNSNYMLTLAYRNSDGSNKFVIQVPKSNSVLATQTWVDGIYYKEYTQPTFTKMTFFDPEKKNLEMRIEPASTAANRYQFATRYSGQWERVQIPFKSGTLALIEDLQNDYFLSGRTGTTSVGTEVQWNSKSGIYNQAYTGFSSIVLHFHQGSGSSTPALQFRGEYANRGLWYRTARDNVGFPNDWAKIYTTDNKPTTSELNVYSKTESDAKYATLKMVSHVGQQVEIISPNGTMKATMQNNGTFSTWNGNGNPLSVDVSGNTSVSGTIQSVSSVTARTPNRNTIFGVFVRDKEAFLSLNIDGTWVGELHHPKSTGTIATQQWSTSQFAKSSDVYAKSVVYTKTESDAKYQAKGNFALVGASYTKAETDGKYALKAGNNAQNFNGNEGSFTDVTIRSDSRVKSNVVKIDMATDKVKMLTGYTYDLKLNDNRIKKSAGIIAQEVQKVLPELVECDDIGLLKVSYNGLIGLLINSINELELRLSKLEKR